MQLPSLQNHELFNLLWLRRDLRFDDNLTLAAASSTGLPVLPIFIYDKQILDELDNEQDMRVNFIHKMISEMDDQLRIHESGIMTLYGNPTDIFKQIFESWPVNKVFFGEDFEPYARERDAQIAQLAIKHNKNAVGVLDHIIHHPAEVVKSDGSPYQVYTPYSKFWIDSIAPTRLKISTLKIDSTRWVKHEATLHDLSSIGFRYVDWNFPHKDISSSTINNYKDLRDRPAQKGNSNLGIHLRFGTISIRKLIRKAQNSNDNTFLKQLIWREFFTQIMYHFPNSMTEEFKAKYRNMPWKYSDEFFTKWKSGMTGIPIVDAGMRELNETGTMHNRVRMITASWLTKNLLIDWRLGERYFASKLLDFELASNVGSWQWVAGTGCDAAPYFRIFNPFTQAKKFDPDSIYIKKWIPELNSLSYPAPMIDYKASRAACLEFYKKHAR